MDGYRSSISCAISDTTFNRIEPTRSPATIWEVGPVGNDYVGMWGVNICMMMSTAILYE